MKPTHVSRLSQGQRRLAAIMFTDMVGYTALSQSDESQALKVLERHNRLLRPFFPRFNGREVKAIGDSFLVEFISALDATNCAIEIQRFLHDYNMSSRDEWKITLRIGVHLGDVEQSGADILGDAVNIASRLQPLAEPEGICVSDQVFGQVRNKISRPLVKMEPRELKNVRYQVDVYKVVMPWEKEGAETEAQLDSKRIAVLPFVSMSPDPNDEYFADGMTEELISRVSSISELNVISRTSVMQYKGKSKPIGEIGRELKAGTILEGSVRKADSFVRVTAQLIDTTKDKHLWSQNYDRELKNVFAIQSDIAQSVAEALRIRLLEEDVQKIGRLPTKSMEAHDLYLKGRFYLHRGYSEPDLRAAKEYFEQAIKNDNTYALAYASLADVYNLFGLYDITPSVEAFSKAEELSRKAVSLDGSLPEGHLSLSNVLRFRRDLDGALKEMELALQLGPNSAEAHVTASFLFGHIPRMTGRVLEESRKALELDPLSSSTLQLVGSTYLYNVGRVDEALDLYQKAVALDSTNAFALGNLGMCYVRKGLYDKGIYEIKRAIEVSGQSNPYTLSDLAYALAKAGRTAEARETITKLIQYQETHGTGSTALASAYASVGEKEEALKWLEVAYTEQSGYLSQLAFEFGFEDLRSDPRFRAFLKRIGLITESS
jgi:TolB-like protein/Tfp pilus assembly protein PilF